MSLTPADIRKMRFSTVRLRPGYNEDDVDALLDRAEETLSALDGGAPDGPLLSAEEVEASRFRGTRLSAGYNEDEVDDFLDELAAALRDRGLARRGDTPPARKPSSGPETWGATQRRATGPLPTVPAESRPRPADGRTPAEPPPRARGAMKPEDINRKRFATTRLTTGYNEDEVDDFLDTAEVTLDALIRGRPDRALLTADQVEHARFATTRARPGYDPAQVDAFLDELATELRNYEVD